MKRVEKLVTPYLHIGIVLGMLAVFAADFRVRLGIIVWIFYLVPLAVSLLTWRPSTPILVAAGSTLLIVIDYFLSPPGIDIEVVETNRFFGVVTLFGVSFIGYRFIQSKVDARRQEWVRAGLAELNVRMRGEQTLSNLGDKALRYLAELLDAQVAAMYAGDAGGPYARVAAFAGEAGRHAADVVMLGEGLAGQAAKDARIHHVRDVPESHLPVRSSLGTSKPRELIVAPAQADGEVLAIVELGFLHRTYPSDLELLESASQAIGTAVRSARYRARLEELLAETQRQAEELQAQQEELRVTNEELEEQSRALRESQARLEAQQAELEASNTQLEEQTQLLEAQKEDLTQTQSALVHKADELGKVSQYKSEFLANMSHELRTPLNSSLILAKLLADNKNGNLTSDQVRFAQTIYSAGNDLLMLINDILDLSKIEAGKVEVHAEAVPVKHVMDGLVHAFQPMAQQKQLAFHATIEDGVPDIVRTDSQRLQQILRNLVSNALKFTDHGEIAIRIYRPGNGRIAFAVRDTGIGIATEQQSTIFDAFRQADGTTHRRYGGTGLGLSISRDLARLLGGELRVESERGKGSTFTCWIPEVYVPKKETEAPSAVADARATWTASPEPRPAARQTPPPRPPMSPAPSSVRDDRNDLTPGDRVVLVIEDDTRFAEILCDLAHELHFKCIVAERADEGIALAGEHTPSGIILDVNLPDHSGLSVLDRLKRNPATRHIPVHVVSVADHVQQAMAMGAVGYAQKPVRREELIEAFERLEAKLTQTMRHVLVVEDDARQRDSICELLAADDVRTTAVATVADALARLGSQTFDCMVMDLALPDGSGYELLERMTNEDVSFPPVIVYTGRSLSAEEEQKLRRYSKSIIIKGARSPERLLDEVMLFLHQVEAKLPPERRRMLREARDREAVFEGRRILVVEDDVRNVFALSSLLEPKGAKIEIARNGREALEALEKRDQKGGPIDLVLMDIMMPEMDGLQAMREIRKRPEWRKLPIIALTAKAMRDDQEKCLDAGANDYIAKPLDVEKLLSLVRVWMPK